MSKNKKFKEKKFDRINRENYIHIAGWMITDLKLKGSELIIYAIIYGFTQAENQVFNGSLEYLAQWTNSSKQSVLNNLKSLLDKKYIIKKEQIINNVKFVEYYSNNLNTPSQKSLMGGSQKSLPNNIYTDTILDNIKESNKKKVNNKIYNQIQNIYNEICTSLTKCTKITEQRKKMIDARLKDYTVEDFEKVFKLAQASDFLSGRNGKWNSCNFDWLIRPNNFVRVIEGTYNKNNKKIEKGFLSG